MSKTINDNEYLIIKVSAKDALFKAHKAISEGNDDCNFSLSEVKYKASDNHPDFKGSGVAMWINKEKEETPKLLSGDIQ